MMRSNRQKDYQAEFALFGDGSVSWVWRAWARHLMNNENRRG